MSFRGLNRYEVRIFFPKEVMVKIGTERTHANSEKDVLEQRENYK